MKLLSEKKRCQVGEFSRNTLLSCSQCQISGLWMILHKLNFLCIKDRQFHETGFDCGVQVLSKLFTLHLNDSLRTRLERKWKSDSATPWTTACQASLSITKSQSPPKPMSIELVMPSNHLIFHRPLLLLPSIFPSNRVFSNESALPRGGQSIGVSASTSVLPMNAQDWSPLGWTDWISLQSKGLSRVFSNTTIQKHQLFGNQLYLQSSFHIHTRLLEKP